MPGEPAWAVSGCGGWGAGMAQARRQSKQHLAGRPPGLRGPCSSVVPDRGRGSAGHLAACGGALSPGPTQTTSSWPV